ncbi:LPS O-antigen chain length determinant protein WzzB [Beggiatoa alba]|nr:LPS O-antigen chain length determinant protein WzzB [Beggiatoa alba]
MDSDKQVQNLPAYQPTLVHEDEISLVDIACTLLRHKKLILGITAVSVCMGLLYAFSIKRVYQVEAILAPPTYEQVQALNVVGIQNMSTNEVFSVFSKNLKTRSLRKAFFDKSNILESLAGETEKNWSEKEIYNVFEGFSDSLKVTNGKKSGVINITLEGTEKDKIGVWLDGFIESVHHKTVKQLLRNLQIKVNSEVTELKAEITSKRVIYKKRRGDELSRMQEAYQIAKSLGIQDHLFVPDLKGNLKGIDGSEEVSSTKIYRELNNIAKRLSSINNLSGYMKGTKLLQAEINALNNRTSDDSYIGGLRDLQEKLSKLEAIKIEKNNFVAVLIDKKAVIDIESNYPQRKLIVMLSLVLGGILGIFGVFISEMFKNVKNFQNKEPNIGSNNDVAKT